MRIGISGQCSRDMLGRRSGPFRGACWLPVLVEIITEGGDSPEKRGPACYCGNRTQINHTDKLSCRVVHACCLRHIQSMVKCDFESYFLLTVGENEDSRQILCENSITIKLCHRKVYLSSATQYKPANKPANRPANKVHQSLQSTEISGSWG